MDFEVMIFLSCYKYSYCSTMDSSTKEECSEAQNDIFILPVYILSLILTKLSRTDILNVKLVSRGFYNIIHENYHLLDRRKVRCVHIEYDKRYGRHPFCLKMAFGNVIGENLHIINYRHNEKSAYFECDEGLSRFLKMFDIKHLDYLHVSSIDDNINIFGILNKFFQKGTKADVLSISKLSEKDLTSFLTFIRKFASVRQITLNHICAPSMGTKDVCSLFSSLSSFNTIKYFRIVECHKTMILSTDFVINLLRNNPNIKHLDVGSCNINFLGNVFKEFFVMKQPRIMKNECDNIETILVLFFGCELKQLDDILRKDFSFTENAIEEVLSEEIFSREFKEYESKLYCRYCPKNRHEINRFARVYYCDNTCQKLDSIF
uniref:F-box domain-containing protein n=1 Tax=Strongyloides venezuelensis TaxID=75913 RepID=A0A0K0FGD4_STRVS